MGGSQSVETFSIHLAELKTKTVDINDHNYWAKLFTQKLYHLDVFDSINEKDITFLRVRKPENLAILIFKCVEQIHLFSQQKDSAATTGDRSLSVTTALVFLARILPYILFRIDQTMYRPGANISEYAADFAMHVLVNNMMCMRDDSVKNNNNNSHQAALSIPPPSAVPSNSNDDNDNDDDDATEQQQHHRQQQSQKQRQQQQQQPSTVPAHVAAAAGAHLIFPQLEAGRPLGDTMIRAITAVAFVPGFTCGAKQIAQELTAEYEVEMERMGYEYLHPEVLWKSGIRSNFMKHSPLNTDQACINRSLVIRALLSAFASQAYAANGNQPARLRYFFSEPRENPLCQSLVASMLAVICNYYPYGTLPYTSHIVSNEESLVADCVSALTVIFDTSIFHQELAPDAKTGRSRRLIHPEDALDGHAAWNLINHLQPSDFEFISHGLLTLLSNNAYSRMTYLPGSQRVLPFRDEVFILLWKLVYKSRNFRKQFCSSPDLCRRLVVPMVTLLIDGIDNNATRASMLQLAVMLLETFSMERDFAMALNVPFVDYTPFKLPAWQGTYFDLVVYGVHACLACRNRAALSMHHAALCTVANMAPCATSISMLSSMKLMQLFEQYAKKEWLESAQPPDHMLQVVLYAIASSMQYQFTGSTHLAYALLRRSAVVKEMWEYIRARSVAVTSENGAPPPISAEETSSASSSSSSSEASSSDDAGNDDDGDGKVAAKNTKKSEEKKKNAAAAVATVPKRPRFSRSVLTHIFTLKCTVEALEALVLDKLKNDPNFDVHSLLQNITLVGKVPVPHPLLIHRVPESPEIDHWITSVVWSTLNSRSTLSSRPLLHAGAIRLFARPQPVQQQHVPKDDDSSAAGSSSSSSSSSASSSDEDEESETGSSASGASATAAPAEAGKVEGHSEERDAEDHGDDEERMKTKAPKVAVVGSNPSSPAPKGTTTAIPVPSS